MPFSIQEKVKPWVDILLRYFDITNLGGWLVHNSSRSQTEIQVKYHSCHLDHCPDRISNCLYSQRHCHNLLPLPHIGVSWCSKHVLHFHQCIL